jgi:hypothetical protein
MAGAVLDYVEMFDQQIAAARQIAEQSLYFDERLRLDLTALALVTRAARSFAGMAEFTNATLIFCHRSLPAPSFAATPWQNLFDL